MKVFALSTLMFAGLAVAQPGPPPPDARPPLYFPTKVGTKWVYSHPDFDRTAEIRSVEDKDGTKLVTVATVSLPKRGARQIYTETYAVSEKGLAMVKFNGYPFPEPLLKLPHKAGETWKVSIPRQRNVKEHEATHTALEPEAVEVPAGKYTAVRVQSVKTSGREIKTTSWYAPDVGPVKFTSDGYPGELVLKSFTPGK
jgi:hypothetical protein